MTTQTHSEVADTTTTAPATGAGEPSFSEYEAMRRSGTYKPAAEERVTAAPKVEKSLEQKKSTASESVETEEEEEEDFEEESLADESKDESSEKPKKQGGFQRRIGKMNVKLTQAQKLAEERAKETEYWKAIALKDRAEIDTKKSSAETTEKLADDAPNPDDFDDHKSYVVALTKWSTSQVLKERDQESEKSKLKTAHEKSLEAHSNRVKAFAEKTEDFNDVLESVDDIPVSPTIAQILLESENGPALMYELAKKKEEYARINALSPIAASRELGKFEARMTSNTSAETKPEAKKITKAPNPISAVGGGNASVGKSIDDPNLSFGDYVRLRNSSKRRGS